MKQLDLSTDNITFTQQSLWTIQAGLHQDAAKLAVGLQNHEQSLSLQIAIKYEQNDIAGQARVKPAKSSCQRPPKMSAPSAYTLHVAKHICRLQTPA